MPAVPGSGVKVMGRMWSPGWSSTAATSGRELTWRARRWASRRSLYVLSWVSRRFYGLPYHPDLFESRIFFGHLRGHYLAMPKAQVGAGFLLGTFERPVVRAFRAFVRPASVAYDVGTSYGYHTLYLARLVGPEGTVFGFEPHPRDHRLLVQNLDMNGVRNVRPMRAAVAGASGSVAFATFGYPGVSHIVSQATPGDADVITVPAVSLDDFVFAQGHPAPAFIKVDVEGGETGVLEGAQEVLRRHRPVVVAEVSAANAPRVAQLMDCLGYRAERLMGTSYQADMLFTPRGSGASGLAPSSAASVWHLPVESAVSQARSQASR
jgi:FkbM family methyltransferase